MTKPCCSPVDESDAGNVLAGDEKLKDFSPRTGPSRSFSYTKTASPVYEPSKIGLSYTDTAFPVYESCFGPSH